MRAVAHEVMGPDVVRALVARPDAGAVFRPEPVAGMIDEMATASWGSLSTGCLVGLLDIHLAGKPSIH